MQGALHHSKVLLALPVNACWDRNMLGILINYGHENINMKMDWRQNDGCEENQEEPVTGLKPTLTL